MKFEKQARKIVTNILQYLHYELMVRFYHGSS